jgi:hypothetical protein
MKRRILGLLVAATLLAPVGIAATPTPAIAFTGHHCTRATCIFFTSSYSTARFYYDRRTCDQWKDLSNTYLHGFRTRAALLRKFDRKLHRPC